MQPNLSFVPLILIFVFVFFLFDLIWNFLFSSSLLPWFDVNLRKPKMGPIQGLTKYFTFFCFFKTLISVWIKPIQGLFRPESNWIGPNWPVLGRIGKPKKKMPWTQVQLRQRLHNASVRIRCGCSLRSHPWSRTPAFL